jgi:3-oxosteroid 1-dehydrogenase
MREQYNRFKLFNRYAMDLTETFSADDAAQGLAADGGQGDQPLLAGPFHPQGFAPRQALHPGRGADGRGLQAGVRARRGAAASTPRWTELVDDATGKVSGVKVSNFGRNTRSRRATAWCWRRAGSNGTRNCVTASSRSRA